MRSLDVIGKRRFRLFRSARGGLGVAAYPLFMENNTALLIEDGSELYLG